MNGTGKLGTSEPTFDAYATDYDAALNQGLSVSGEDKDFFARGRVAWLAGRLARLDLRPRSLLDFGCGTGSATPYFLELLRPESVVGIDPSERSLETATKDHGSDRVRFELSTAYRPAGAVDLAFTNGVFHHIPPAQRAGAVAAIREALRPGGIFAFWENNPWNPGTRYIMSKIPFDREAITLTPPEARRLVQAAGLEVLKVDFCFFFPKALAALRFVEARLSAFPLGAQYLILCRKPA